MNSNCSIIAVCYFKYPYILLYNPTSILFCIAIRLNIDIFLFVYIWAPLIADIIFPIDEILYANTIQLNNYIVATIAAYLNVRGKKSPKPTVIIIVHAQ